MPNISRRAALAASAVLPAVAFPSIAAGAAEPAEGRA